VLRNPDRYKSVSAFAPTGTCVALGSEGLHPLPWLQQRERAYDASELVLTVGYNRPILIDQGTADPFLAEQLLPTCLSGRVTVGQPLTLRFQEGYNHSYYFITTLIENHIRHHAAALCG